MALTPQQLQALFQSLDLGQQSGFVGSTPGMSDDERNQWVNTYGSGGTNYRDFLSWYGGAHGTSGQLGSVNPGQIAQNGSYAANPTMPYLNSITSPTGYTGTAGQSAAPAPYNTPPPTGTPQPTGSMPATTTTPTPAAGTMNVGGASFNPTGIPQNQTGGSNPASSVYNMGQNVKPKSGGYSFMAPGWGSQGGWGGGIRWR